jgi:hypothetical protein
LRVSCSAAPRPCTTRSRGRGLAAPSGAGAGVGSSRGCRRRRSSLLFLLLRKLLLRKGPKPPRPERALGLRRGFAPPAGVDRPAWRAFPSRRPRSPVGLVMKGAYRWSRREKSARPRTPSRLRSGRSRENPGGDLLSRGVSPQVPSARAVFTAVFGMGTGVSPPLLPPETCQVLRSPSRTPERARATRIPSPRPISTGRLNTSPCVHLRPINLVVCQGPYPVDPVGDLISRTASRLDAFSAYPFRRSPTSHAPGGTTGTRELRPSRSSRTRDSSSQISYAHDG